jgi:hypothetical protein
MSLLGGIMRSVINPMSLAQLAMGPAGWASLAMRTIGSAIAQQVIQQLGQRMGLPQPMIDLAQGAFANASGQPGLVRQNIGEAVRGFTEQMDLRPSDAGQLQRELLDTSDKSYENMNRIVDSFAKRLLNGEDGEGEQGGSVLMKIARALGKLMDQKMDSLAAKADQLGRVGGEKGMTTKDGGFNAKGQSKFGQLSAEVQALSQEIGYLSQAIASSIKSIGEASATIARK